MRPSKRDEIIDRALTIFYRHGFHATGMDLVVAESGISKTAIYNNFASKEDLILAVLDRRDSLFAGWFIARVEALAQTPAARLSAIFDALSEWFSSPDFRGCMFIKAASEYQEAEHPIYQRAAAHKQKLFEYTRALAIEARAAHPDDLARGLMLLKEGAIVSAHMGMGRDPAADAKRAAETLLAAALPN